MMFVLYRIRVFLVEIIYRLMFVLGGEIFGGSDFGLLLMIVFGVYEYLFGLY